MDVLTLATVLRAVDPALFWKEGAAQQGGFALGTTEAFVSSMPVYTLIRHLGMVDS